MIGSIIKRNQPTTPGLQHAVDTPRIYLLENFQHVGVTLGIHLRRARIVGEQVSRGGSERGVKVEEKWKLKIIGS